MDYWPSARWKVAITDQGREQWIEPELPFVLIGSHPCCTVRIAEPRVPNYVYLACCFADSVEVWPLCSIAFPRWGVTLPEHSLAVGSKRISLVHQSHSLWPNVAERGNKRERDATGGIGLAQGVRRQITLDWDGKQRPKRLARRVMILGSEHPSTLRLYGQGLAPCDHAVVCADAAVWLINLQPDAEHFDATQLCRPLNSMSAPETVGNIQLRLGKLVDPPEKSDSSISPAGISPRLVKTSPSASKTSASKTPAPRARSLKNHPSKNRGSQKRRSSKRSKPKRQKTDRSIKKHAATLSRKKNSPKAPKHSATATPEALTSNLTDQLVRIDHARFTRRRIVMISTITCGFLAALVIVLWIVFVLLIPKISEMMG